ncbi:hypothetical protein L211DRAFT_850761 [Terfezia boudieri ATCC MYA-4762]|uniref:Rhodopsin domain-containing protein n=1 Tax=Terfezia boudieri ATCC MYA-4762 TaxID=1051890 RepID=A0A3N4LH57_9PEZI|nr:hypothetical protein L211DRAFT_850761 [Terfezia boudieri ATCC MYA-4762]
MALISNPDNPVSPPGVLAIAIVFTFIMWLLAGVRFWALRHYTYRTFSPRWISNVAVMLIVVFVSLDLALLFYAYHMVYQMRDLDDSWTRLDDKRYDNSTTQAEMGMIDAAQDQIGAQLMSLGLDTMKSSLAWRLSSTTALWLVKFSIVMVYVELWNNLTKRIRWLMYVTFWTIGLTYVAIITLFCIGMPSDNWGQDKTSDLPIVTEYTYGAANIITDLQVLTIALWSLHIIKLPQSKLYAISLLLFMGCVTISLAIARAILYDAHIRSKQQLDQSVDIIGLVEPLVASWLACLPALRVLFRFRRRSRVGAEELTERMHDLRNSGHARITSGGPRRPGGPTAIRHAYSGEGLATPSSSCCETGMRSPVSNKESTVNSRSNLSPIGAQIVPASSDDEDVGKETGNLVRLSSFTGSDGSTQIGEWRADLQSDGEAEDKGSFNPLSARRQRRLTTESTTPLSPPPLFDSEKLRNAYNVRAKAYERTSNPSTGSPITTLSRNTTSASQKEGRVILRSTSVQEENEDTQRGDRRASGRDGGVGSAGVVMI